jgi:hypothetical protein
LPPADDGIRDDKNVVNIVNAVGVNDGNLVGIKVELTEPSIWLVTITLAVFLEIIEMISNR